MVALLEESPRLRLWHRRASELSAVAQLGMLGGTGKCGSEACFNGRQGEVGKTDVLLEKCSLTSFGKFSPSCKS